PGGRGSLCREAGVGGALGVGKWESLGEQLRCLELQGELRRELLQELAEFMRRRAEVELEYSRGLDRLAERFSGRAGRLGGSGREHQSFRKEPSLLSPLHCWAVLLQQTRQQSRESATLSEVLGGPIAQRLSHIAEDVGRIVKKSKDLEQQLQEELLEVVSELQTVRTPPPGLPGHREASAPPHLPEPGSRWRTRRRHAKFLEHKLKCTKARNEYLLTLASVNAAVRNYYLRDVLDLMDCCDTGFHLALGQVLRSYAAAERCTQASQMQALGSLEEAVEALDPPGDKAKVLEVHAVAFCPPLRFDYQPHEGDEVAEIRVEMELRDEILPRAQNIQSRLDRQTIETEEVNKTLKATLQALLEVVASEDGDMLDSFQASPSTESLKSTSSDPGVRQAGRRRGQQQDTETFYVTKLQEYLSGRSILAKLQAKHEKLQEAIQRGDKEEQEVSRTQYTQRKFQKSRPPRPSSQYNQKLFGGDMEKFIQSSGQPVPLVVESCIRFINLNGEWTWALLPPPPAWRPSWRAPRRLTCAPSLAQYSDENMMDPYNLAVCFGPTLLPVPAGQDPVALQARVNQLVQTLIVQPARVFPPLSLLPGPVYEKCMAPPSASCLGDAQLEGAAGENEPELEAGTLAQEDDLEGVVEAVACFAYTGRTAQELTFQRGDVLRLHERASGDWWRGELAGARGLIPHKYITLPGGAEKPAAGQGLPAAGELASGPEGLLALDFIQRPEPCTPLGGPSGHRRHCLVPTSPERHVEMDKAVAQTMDSVFKELLGKTASRQGLGPAPTNSPGPGPRSPKPAACSRLGKNKGFSRGPGTPASPSTAHPQGLDSLLKPH
uniref:Rho GTPase activating protein 4 n=1 Tax=Sus scrofa TaxID=9823 RepID=A0A8D0MTA0_PIG